MLRMYQKNPIRKKKVLKTNIWKNEKKYEPLRPRLGGTPTLIVEVNPLKKIHRERIKIVVWLVRRIKNVTTFEGEFWRILVPGTCDR